MRRVLAILFLATLLLSACGRSASTSVETETPTPTPAETISTSEAASEAETEMPTGTPDVTEAPAEEAKELILSATIASADGTFTLHFPEGYADVRAEMAEEVAEAYPLCAGSVAAESFLMARAEPKEGSYVDDFREYHTHMKELFLSQNEGVEEMRFLAENAEIAGMANGIKSTLQTSYAGQQLFYALYAVELEDAYLQVYAWSPLSRMAETEKHFDAIVQTYEKL